MMTRADLRYPGTRPDPMMTGVHLWCPEASPGMAKEKLWPGLAPNSVSRGFHPGKLRR